MASQGNSHMQFSNPAPVFCPSFPTVHHPPGSPATPGPELSTVRGTQPHIHLGGDMQGPPPSGECWRAWAVGRSNLTAPQSPLRAVGQRRPTGGARGGLQGWTRCSDPASAQRCRPDGSPVQVEGGDLRIVSLVVREIKKVRGRLLLSRLPRENGTKQRGRSLRAPSSGRLVPTHERRLLNFQEFCEPAVNIVIVKNDTSLRLSHVSKAINTSQLFYNVSVSAGLQPAASLTAAGGNSPWWGCTSPQLYH